MTMRNVVGGWMAVVLAAVSLSCGQKKDAGGAAAQSQSQPASTTNPTIYQVKGVIREVYLDRKKVKIAHEDIPGYMEAMVMMLDVRDVKELSGLVPGDNVTFRMLVTDDDGWIDQIKKLDGPRTPLPAEPPSFRRVREVEPLAVGDMMPEYTFTNTSGRVVKLSDYRGSALAITFIFTRCPFPTFCPRLSTSFSDAQNALKTQANGPTNWNLLSITIDPEYDTPERLKAYADRYKADPKRWEFVTGDLTDITAIGEQFGLQFWRANPNEPINHNVRTFVVDASGRIQWVTPETDWKWETLVEQMNKAAQVKPAG